jgi:anthranilate phosphoribosyltransferase
VLHRTYWPQGWIERPAFKSTDCSRTWWHTPLIPALGRQRRVISEFEASLVYKVSSRTARAIQRNLVLKKQKNKKQKTTTTTTKKPVSTKKKKKEYSADPEDLGLSPRHHLEAHNHL